METKTLGLITAPGVTSRMGAGLKEELPDMLSYYVSEEYEWEVMTIEDSLTGGTNDSVEVLESSCDMKKKQSWDFAITLTDLPLFNDNKIIVAEALKDDQVALISLPGLGLVPMYKRIREAILQLMNEIHHGSSDADRRQAEAHIQSKSDGKYKEIQDKDVDRLLNKRFFELIFPLNRETPENEEDIKVRFTTKSRINGITRLLGGMVSANRPWEMFAAFIKVLVIAFTTGSYALVFPTLWTLSSYYTVGRLILLMSVAILALIFWIITAHGLWERKHEEELTFVRRIYNATTFFSLLFAVLMYYVLLFVLFSFTTFLLIPGAQLESQLQSSIGIGDYFLIAWTATSISTIIGGLGSVFEKENVVLETMYGYRQRQRQKKIRQEREEEEEKKN